MDKKEIINQVFVELMGIPKEEFQKLIEETPDSDMVRFMLESGAAEIKAKEFHDRWCVEKLPVVSPIGQSYNGSISASKSEDEGSIPSCPANKNEN